MNNIYTILGAGLAGLSTADHLRRKGIGYVLYEAKAHAGGHVYSHVVDGFVWDEGPHVSFTKHAYVKEYFADNCAHDFLEHTPKPTNYFKRHWVPHPAQANLFAIPDKLRAACIEDVKAIRNILPKDYQPENYQDWIDYAFGKTFANYFPAAYTRKYWTTEPRQLTTEWIGKRVYFPEIADMLQSADGPLQKQTHYISTIRYPKKGGYYTYIKSVADALSISFQKKLHYISFAQKQLFFEDGSSIVYEKLISTLPLPQLIKNSDAPTEIKVAAAGLNCSQVLLVNVVVDHPTARPNHWIYVYDEDKYATRINFTELLSPDNGQPGRSGIQVEVYFSAYHELDRSIDEIAAAVLEELVEMELVHDRQAILSYHHSWIDWANVIFDHKRETALDIVLNWLASQGLERESDDLGPMTDWEHKEPQELGDIILAGRFAQWRYYWTDDCVMRGRFIAEQLADQKDRNHA